MPLPPVLMCLASPQMCGHTCCNNLQQELATRTPITSGGNSTASDALDNCARMRPPCQEPASPTPSPPSPLMLHGNSPPLSSWTIVRHCPSGARFLRQLHLLRVNPTLG